MLYDKSKFYVVMPAFNEERMIYSLLVELQQYADNIIVVDDGSSDKTVEEVRKTSVVLVENGVNRGKGTALMIGMKEAFKDEQCEYVITMDADGQHSPCRIKDFVDVYEKYHPDAIIGNRMWNIGAMPWTRRVANRYMTWLLCRRAGISVHDTQNGYRLYTKKVIKFFPEDLSFFSAESEMLICMGINSCSIMNMNVDVIYGDEESSIHPFRDSVRFFKMLRKYKKK